MIVSHSHRFVYVHPPRTGGTSVTAYLSALTTYRDLELGGTFLGEVQQDAYFRRFGVSKHSTYREVLDLDPSLSEYAAFGTWRPPLDRVRSIFAFLSVHDAEVAPEWRETLHGCRDAREFLDSPLFATDGPDRMFLPQRTWLEGVPVILPLADLEEALPAFLLSIGAPIPPGPLPHLNGSAWDPDPTLADHPAMARYAEDLR